MAAQSLLQQQLQSLPKPWFPEALPLLKISSHV